MLRARSTEDLDGEPSAKRLCVDPEALFESQNFVISQPDLVEYIFSQELLPHPIYEIDDFDFSFYGSCRGVSKLWNTVAEKCAIIFANAMGPKGFLLLKDFTHAAKTKKESKQRLKDLLNRKGTMIDVYYHNGKKKDMLKAVKQLPNLRHINLQNHSTSIEKVASCCPKLQSISITNNIGTKAIEKIEKLKNLDSIELHEAFMLDSTILNFKNVFSNIQYLFFTAKCTSTGLQMLLSYAYANMKTVSLCLRHFNHTVNLTSVIKSFPNTTQIHLQEVKIVTDKLINVHSNASLLDLSGSHLCDSDLSTIAISFPNLTYLNLQNTNISDRGLSDLASCCPTPIEILTYGSDYITSDWCMHIQNRYPHIYFSDLE